MGKNTGKGQRLEREACHQVLDDADCEGVKCKNNSLVRKVTRHTFGLQTQERMFVPEHDFLPAARERIIMVLGFITVVFFTPFALFSLWRGQLIAAAFYALIVVLLLVNSYRLHRARQMLIPAWVILNIILVALIHSISIRGVNALFWCYPAAFFIFFLSQRSHARINMAVYLSSLIPAAFYFVPVDVAVRFAVTLLMVCVSSDVLIGILGEFQSRLAESTIRDPLTNAYNRRYLMGCLERAITNARKNAQPAVLIAFDIDHFKRVNDTYGHQAGDRALTGIVDIVDGLLEQQYQSDHVFRLGGEEFLVLLNNTSLPFGILFAEEIRTHIALTPLIADAQVTISLGVTEYRSNEYLDDWLKCTDDNLYRAKAKGRNCVYAGNDSPQEKTAPALL